MSAYAPPFHGQLTSNDPQGYRSCVAYSASYAIADATAGASTPTGEQVRIATGDVSGGLELAQVATVMGHYDIAYSIGVFNRAIYEERLASGKWGAVLIGGEAAVQGTAYGDGSSFRGNHAWYERPGNVVMDPLADGRHPGGYKFQGAAYPLATIRTFAADLTLSNGGKAGPDHFECILVPLPDPRPPKPVVRVVGRFATYTVHNTGKLHAVGSTWRTDPLNTVLPVGLREWGVLVGSKSVLMRQVTGGTYAGLWVVAHGSLRYSQ